MNCINCGAPARLLYDKGYFICDYCNSLFIPNETDEGIVNFGERSDVNCPVCKIQLVFARISNNPVLYCERCRGLLINAYIFLKTVEALRARPSHPPLPPIPMDPDDLHRVVHCPYCGKTMDTHPYGGPGNIVIDNCADDAVNWLDYKEFTRVISAPGEDRGEWPKKKRRN